MSPSITLSGAGLRCEIKPELGGCIAGLWLDDVPVLRSTPAAVLANANAAINAALKDKSVIDSLALMGLVAQGSTAAEMDKSQKEENVRWGPLVKKIGFTAES